MKLFLIILFFAAQVTYSQSFTSIYKGLGIEFGIGQNNLYWSTEIEYRTPGVGSTHRTEIDLGYHIRLIYHANLFDSFLLIPFVGCNQIGGKGKNDSYTIETLELGLFFLLNISDFNFGIGSKYNAHQHVKYDLGTTIINRANLFTDNSVDLGFRASYKISRIVIGIETWIGLSNLADGPMVARVITHRPVMGSFIAQNHFRFIIGIVV